MSKDEVLARSFCESIRKLAQNEDRLENFELYLSNHFSTWMKRHASTPEDMVFEMDSFANMEI